MADSTQTDSSNWWEQFIAPKQAQPVSGTAFQSGTQALNSVGSINLQNSAGSGFAASTQGPTVLANQNSNSVPDTNAANNANGQNISNLQAAATGNTQSLTNQQQISLINPSVPGQGSGPSGTVAGQGTSPNLASTGLNQAVSKLTGNVFDSAINSVDDFGSSLGFGASSAAQDASNLFDLSEAGDIEGLTDLTGAGEGIGATAGELSSASLSSVLGAAGLGYTAGGLLSNVTGGNKTGSSIGGGIGAAAGYAIGGPIGGVIGTVGGSYIGGMFGNNTPATSASEFSEGLTPNGQNITPSYGAKNNGSNINETVANSFNNVASNASSALGINFNPQISLHGGYNTLHSGGPQPGFIQVNAPNQPMQSYFFSPQDINSVSDAYFGALTNIAAQSGYTDTQALHNWYYGSQDSNQAQSSNPITIAPKV